MRASSAGAPISGSGARVRLTPLDLDAGGVFDFVEGRAIVGFKTRVSGGVYEYRLASVPLDGSEADTPTYISPADIDARHVSVRGDRIVFVGERGNESAIFDGPALPSARQPTRLTPWVLTRLYFDGPTERWVYFCDYAGSVYRVERTAETTQPQRLVSFERPNHCALGGLTGQDRFLVVHDHPTGNFFLLPADGGALQPVPFVPRRITSLGIATVEFGREMAAAFMQTNDGQPVQLTPWHETRIEGAHLIDEELVYRTAAPDDRWYAAALDGSGSDTANPISAANVGTAVLGKTSEHAVIRGTTMDGESRVAAYPLDGSAPGGITILSGRGVAPSHLHPQTGRVVLGIDGEVVSARISGANANAPLVIADGLRWVTSLALDPLSSVVFAGGADEVVKTSVDGQASVETLATGDGIMGLTFVPEKNRLLVALVTTDTAVPHPREVLTVPVDGSEPAHVLGGPGMFPVGVVEDGFEPITISFGVDGWIVLRGSDGLYGTTVEGLGEPTKLLDHDGYTRVLGGYAPNARRMVADVDQQLFLLEADGHRPFTDFEGYVQQAVWSTDGEHFVFSTNTPDGLRILATEPSGPGDGVVQELALLERGGKIVGPAPQGGVIIQSSANGDVSLYRAVPVEPGAMLPMTPIDDAEEHLVGFIRSAE